MNTESLSLLLPWVKRYEIIGYLAVFLLSFGESLAFLGIVFPGTFFLVFAGFLSAKGFLGIDNIILLAISGATLGDFISFYAGRKGINLFNKKNRLFNHTYLKKGEEFFKKHGIWSILFGKFVGPIRSVMPFTAGLFSMNIKIFLAITITSAVIWATSLSLLGFFFWESWALIDQ